MSQFLLEIGTEELPAGFANDARKQFSELTEKWLKENNLSFSAVKSYSTPRRLVLLIDGLPLQQPDLVKEVKGPPVNNAYDSAGNPSKALLGFCSSQNVSPEKLEQKELKGNLFIFATVTQTGKKTIDLLPALVPHLINSLAVARSMRWGDANLRFSRPLHWIIAFFADQFVKVELENLTSGNTTYGHRFLGKGALNIENTSEYFPLMRENSVLVDNEERKENIVSQLKALAAENQAVVRIDEDLLDEVNQLVEMPYAILGSFSEKYLAIPDIVSVTVMKSHQRYFPLFSNQGELLPNFITISNMNINPENIRKGNEKVLRARLEDGMFYYNEDIKVPLQDNLEELKRVTFFEEIGSIYDKTLRIEKIAHYLQKKYFSDVSSEEVTTAVSLSKTDLVTYMVQEFTELQGEIGYYYAKREGFSENIALALREQYLPTGNNEELPSIPLSQIVNFADKLDNIISCFSLGKIPTGSKDPYALRRQALGIIKTCEKYKIQLNLEELLNYAWNTLNEQKTINQNQKETVDKICEFFSQRLKNDLLDKGYRYDLVDAVLQSVKPLSNLYSLQEKVRVLDQWVKNSNVNELIMSLARVIRICKEEATVQVSESLFEKEAEKNLYHSVNSLTDALNQSYDQNEFSKFLDLLGNLVKPINEFFDQVMVMVENPEIKNNRLALLNMVKIHADRLANMDKIII